MTIENTTQGFIIFTIANNQLIKKHYIGYLKREAKEDFKHHIKTLTSAHGEHTTQKMKGRI